MGAGGDGIVIVRADFWPSRSDWSGVVVDVYVSLGDRVGAGDVVLELEVEKAVIEVESPVDGVVVGVHVSKGDSVRAGDPLVSIKPL